MSFQVYVPDFLVYAFVWLLWIAAPLLLLAVALGSAYNLFKTTPGYVSVVRAARALHNGRPLFDHWEKEVARLEKRLTEAEGDLMAARHELSDERMKTDPNLNGYGVIETIEKPNGGAS